MSIERIFKTLAEHGIHLTRDAEGALRAGPAAAVTPELAALIRAHRAALLAALAPPPGPLAVREFYEERAAVFEFDGGLTRAEAEAGALRPAPHAGAFRPARPRRGRHRGRAGGPDVTAARAFNPLMRRHHDHRKHHARSADLGNSYPYQHSRRAASHDRL